MSPKLTGNESNKDLNCRKYIRVSNEIVSIDDGDRYHMQIVKKYSPNQPFNNECSPIVDDKGVIEVIEGKLAFSGVQTGTVAVRNVGDESRKETYEVARRLFGCERIG